MSDARMHPRDWKYLLAGLATAATKSLLAAVPPAEIAAVEAQVARAMDERFQVLPEPEREQLLQLLEKSKGKPVLRNAGIQQMIIQPLGVHGLRAWAEAHAPPGPDDRLQAGIDSWLASERGKETWSRLLDAGFRERFNRATEEDNKLMTNALASLLAGGSEKDEKEIPMAVTFFIDSRRLPPDFDQAKFEAEVKKELTNTFLLPDSPENAHLYAVIKGMLLLEEQYVPAAYDFTDALQRAWRETLGKTRKRERNADGTQKDAPNRETYKQVGDTIAKINGSDKVAVQQLASVSRFVIDNADQVPVDHEDFNAQVRIGLEDFLRGGSLTGDTLLPQLETEQPAEPENIRTVALAYACLQLERARVIHVVERVNELYFLGLLPIRFEAKVKIIDEYEWSKEDRMPEPGRMALYGRLFGVAGADISKEVTPNREFDTLFLRFMSSISEYERHRRISEIIDTRDGQRRAATVTTEQVRKAGRDLTNNCSSIAWGGTAFLVRRMAGHFAKAMEILKLPQIQKVYGVTNPWQVVERVAQSQFGLTPNIVKYKTMAESGRAILDLLAKNHRAFSVAASARPLFEEDERGGDIPSSDAANLLRHTQHWLAVNGIADEQVDKMSQPSDTVYAPSIPNFFGGGSQPGASAANPQLDRLRQMVASGTTPSLEQLQQMLPAMKASA